MLHGNWHCWYVIHVHDDNLYCFYTQNKFLFWFVFSLSYVLKSATTCMSYSFFICVFNNHHTFTVWHLSIIITRENYSLLLNFSHVTVLSSPYTHFVDPRVCAPLFMFQDSVLIPRELEPASSRVPVVVLWNYSRISILFVGN